MEPRLIRLKEAPKYLGMSKNWFNAEVRPYIAEFRLSKQAVSFDRLDLDTWIEQTKPAVKVPLSVNRSN